MVEQSIHQSNEKTWQFIGGVILFSSIATFVGLINYFLGSTILKAAESHSRNDAMFRGDTLRYGAGCLMGLVGVAGYGITQFLVFGGVGIVTVLKSKEFAAKLLGYSLIFISGLSLLIYYLTVVIRYIPTKS